MAEILVLSDFLPEELVDEILIRLPIKSMVRFESVSKSWNSRLHSTSFNELYKKRNNKAETKRMKLENLYKMAPKLIHKGMKLDTEFSVMGPLSNGIYCLTSGLLFRDGYSRESEIALCNLTTRRFKFLPPFPPRLHDKLDSILGSNAVFGFDRAPNNDYRVVVIINYELPIFYHHRLKCFEWFDRFLVLVYSSNSGEWEVLVDYVPGKKAVGPPSALRVFTEGIRNIVTPTEVCSQRLLKGRWHWMVSDDEGLAVLSFDFANQSFHLIKGPPEEISLRADVVVLHDSLAVISLHEYGVDSVVWMMKEYGDEKSWSKIFNIRNRYEEDMLTKLCRVEYSVVQGDNEENGSSDSVVIEKIFFVDKLDRNIVCFDHQGERQVIAAYNFRNCIHLNIGGISNYKETLEYLP